MGVLPLRFNMLDAQRFVFADDAGRAFVANEAFLGRYATDQLSAHDFEFLERHGFVVSDCDDDLPFLGHVRRLNDRFARRRPLNYVILVPTLRCNLRCSYCQVLRVNEDREGFDWTDQRVDQACQMIERLDGGSIQIEFQGGEPLLRPDLLQRVMDRCRARFSNCRFIICTNLSRLDADTLAIIRADDVFVSTSLDGPARVHQRQRTETDQKTADFFFNLRRVIDVFGPDKVSALPTIDFNSPPDPQELLDAFGEFGMRSIFLRPINHQGFARKSFASLKDGAQAWNSYFDRFVETMLARNEGEDTPFEEYFLSLVMKRCFQSRQDMHVDLRNPNYHGIDYYVVDFDGRIYPTDEARMLTRAGVVDLAIGDLDRGIEGHPTVTALNSEAFNNFDPDCIHCVYQPQCGVDLIDDLSRYGRRDLPRPTTFFCQRMTHLFNKAWELALSDSPATRRSVCHWLDIPYTERALVPVHD